MVRAEGQMPGRKGEGRTASSSGGKRSFSVRFVVEILSSLSEELLVLCLFFDAIVALWGTVWWEGRMFGRKSHRRVPSRDAPPTSPPPAIFHSLHSSTPT